MTLNDIDPGLLFEAFSKSSRRLKKYDPTKRKLSDTLSFLGYITVPAFLLGVIKSRRRNKIDLSKFVRMPIHKRLIKYNGEQLATLIIWSHMKPLEWKLNRVATEQEAMELTLDIMIDIEDDLQLHKSKAAKNQQAGLDKGIKDVRKVIKKLKRKIK